MTTTLTQPAAVIRSVHQRPVVDPERGWQLLVQLYAGPPNDWPVGAWPQLRLNGGLRLGSGGGTGAYRYTLTEISETRLRFTLKGAWSGTHELSLATDRLVSELQLRRLSGLARHTVMPAHDALLESVLDDIDAQLAHPGAALRAHEHSLRVRVATRLSGVGAP